MLITFILALLQISFVHGTSNLGTKARFDQCALDCIMLQGNTSFRTTSIRFMTLNDEYKRQYIACRNATSYFDFRIEMNYLRTVQPNKSSTTSEFPSNYQLSLSIQNNARCNALVTRTSIKGDHVIPIRNFIPIRILPNGYSNVPIRFVL
ncbi:hypothetical protein ACOME3_003495 [Neoechinorhynchus agilis]